VRFNGPVDSTVPQPSWEHVLTALREMLTNVAKHAHATEVVVDVEADEVLQLRVVDDGAGIPANPSGAGEGLRNLDSRARSLGGAFRAEHGATGGTAVEWTVPPAPAPAG
jgi:signal transduction histidine kinase